MEAPENALKINNKFFEVNDELKQLMQEVEFKPYFIGKYLGLMKNKFSPSLAYLEDLSKKSKDVVVLNDKAEWMFLCGKDAFGSNVTGKKSGAVFVNNEHGENLGFGKWLKKNVKNIYHKGMYLKE